MRIQFELTDVWFNGRVHAKGTNQHILKPVCQSLLRRDDAAPDLFSVKRVIRGQLLDLARMQEVSAAVADIDEADPIFVKPCRHYRGTHPVVVRILVGGIEYLSVCQVGGT